MKLESHTYRSGFIFTDQDGKKWSVIDHLGHTLCNDKVSFPSNAEEKIYETIGRYEAVMLPDYDNRFTGDSFEEVLRGIGAGDLII